MSIVPTDVRKAGEDRLAIRWNDGTESVFSVFDLRVACPCATCVDELTGERLLDPARVPAGVRPVRLESVGNYGMRIAWSDGHDTGIYTWERLRRLSPAPEGGDGSA